MPRTHWKRPKTAGRLFLAEGKRDAQGTLLKCRRCPVVEDCENKQYNAKNVTYFYCADDPRERRRDG